MSLLKLYIMDYKNFDYEQTEFSKAILAGLFAGILATCLSLAFNFIFRYYSGFPLSAMINVSTIIFALIIVVMIAGIAFYFSHHYFKKGTIIYQAVFLIVTLLLIAGTMQIQRSNDLVLSAQVRELLLGVIAITGICAVFIIPFFYKHDYL